MSQGTVRQLTILHFNDVYNVEPSGSVGGAARFVTALRSFEAENPLVLFSGDAFSPSTISTVTRGHHMIEVLKACRIDAACIGNHDFDFGIDNLVQCVSACGFPWLLSNINDVDTGQPLADAKASVKLRHAASGLTVGVIGLVELEWVDTLSSIDADDIEFFDFCERGEQLARELKTTGPDPCDLVIALTHMRWPNDRKLANGTQSIDIILGGHDHNYGVEFVNNRLVLKSGTDFRQFTALTVTLPDAASAVVGPLDLELKLETVNVTAERFADGDPGVAKAVDSHVRSLERSMQRQLSVMKCDLECRFVRIRTAETNLGNLFADIVLTAVEADFVLVNSGSFRADALLPAGPFRLGDLHRILPMLDPMVVVEIDGAKVLAVLENGVSQWPALEGRFPQVAGITFRFNGSKPSGSRVDPRSVRIGGKRLRLEANYLMATKHYLSTGKDGYDMLPSCRLLLDEEEGPIWSVAVQNYFLASAVVRGWQRLRNRHRSRLVSMQRRRTLTGQVCAHSTSTDVAECHQADGVNCSGGASGDSGAPAGKKTTQEHWALLRNKVVVLEREESVAAYASPKVEGRIVETSQNGGLSVVRPEEYELSEEEDETGVLGQRRERRVMFAAEPDGVEIEALPSPPDAQSDDIRIEC